MKKYQQLLCLFIILFSGVACVQEASQNNAEVKDEKPNIILIYADDLGPGILGYNGQTKIKTPNIDQLAKDGKVFTNAYGSNVCSPARASILTGLNNAHAPVHTPGGLQCQLAAGLIDQATFDKKIYRKQNEGHYYIGQMAQKAGYTTSYFGKLGFGYSDTAEMIDSYGFDYHCGLLDAVMCWSFYPPHYFENGERILLPNNPKVTKKSPTCLLVGEDSMTYAEDIWLEKALMYIDDKKEEPFFMIYATQLPHGPASIAPKDYVYKDQEGWTELEKVYASMIYKLDQSVGSLVQKLDELGLSENTLIVFASDNGHEIQSYATVNPHAIDPNLVYDYQTNTFNQPIVKPNTKPVFWDGHHSGEDIFNGTRGERGMKRHSYQGGIHLPYIAKWPNKIKASTKSDVVITDYDFMPTIADLINGEIKQTDGISYLPTLIDEGEQQKHDYIFFKNTTGVARDVLIKDGWKLVNEKDVKASDYTNNTSVYKWALYDLSNDPYEKKNVASEFSSKVIEMKKLVKKANYPIQLAQ
ncbi:sulfatase-like hydrolase/transferase [Flammeovirga sp. OC4]|uniref:sulfatase-like hydrolase/transferase n=1 Tax=Flammeovirga sp. OC4 TaxID=1382345 RepID=UPI0005C765C8|nr:sulfatase-like hydrolase/transferase [Flammeovirga sp. OC4]